MSYSINQPTAPISSSNEDLSDRPKPLARVPWQIWIVVALLFLEGIGNLFSIPDNLANLYWLAAKCVLILGLLKGWLVVYILFLAISIIQVAYFLPVLPIASMINFLMLCLAASARKFYIDSALR